jgi:hypothetical protein
VIDWYKKVEKLLNYLLIFLLPSQLALHFWPASAFLFGIRVDYLAPSIYLTDILFLALFACWLIRGKQMLLLWLKKNKFYIFAVFIIAILNIIFSSSAVPSLYKWIKITEMAAFAFYVWARKDFFTSGAIFTTLFLSLLFFSFIGIAQFFKGGTIGGLMYFLGERTFTIGTPGVALVSLGGEKFLRAYSTLPHPNALAGYLGVGILVLAGSYFKKVLSKKTLGLLIIFSCFVLTFSLSAAVASLTCAFFYVLITKKILAKKHVPFIVLLFFLVSLLLPGISKNLLGRRFNFSESTTQRLELAFASGKIISGNFLIGAGLNTFIINEVKITVTNSPLWLLQPVHNIFLLVISEVGVFGALLFYFLLVKVLKEAFYSRLGMFLAVIFILTSGLFDHYWLTLQQNMFLTAFVIGNAFSIPQE